MTPDGMLKAVLLIAIFCLLVAGACLGFLCLYLWSLF